MLRVAISQLTTLRWDLAEEIAGLVEHEFAALSFWRPKLSDLGSAAAAAMLADAGLRASSLQWTGGFTGGDGRTFAESIDDAVESIEEAATLGAPVLVVHSGSRGGHTLGHARRLLVHALESLAPIAHAAGVTLALKPLHGVPGSGCSFLGGPGEALDVVERVAHPAVRLAIDLWHFGDDPQLVRLLPRLASVTAAVQVADRIGPPTADLERLPIGYGDLPLADLLLDFAACGFDGHCEFDAAGERVAELGYEAVLAETRRLTNGLSWMARRPAALARSCSGQRPAVPGPADTASATVDHQLRSAGSRRSHASSQTVSRG